MKRVPKWERQLPEELWSRNYDYPPALFADWRLKDTVLRFDGSDDIPAPVANSERPLLMAKFAVVKSLFGVSHDVNVLAMLARGEKEKDCKRKDFISAIRKVWGDKNAGIRGLADGDIELAGEDLGVYELIWPFDPEAMQEEAAHVKRQFANNATERIDSLAA